ncbi:DUF5926 family protein [Actinomyces wuliandei]|uniref:DUF5926 family protein n=1 Tax=Actinomyces wuliandei TaxID=2057743 RepID=UPI000FDC2339|nr:DUF5926 family protein [Actinomyces wuliandei]
MSRKKRQNRRVGARSGPKARVGGSGPGKPDRPARVEFVARPFAGVPGEEVLVAMMQIIPAATARVRLGEDHGGQDVLLATILPDLAQGMRRSDGEVLVALQTSMHSGDASRDVAAALLEALDLEPGATLPRRGLPEPGPRLQDVLDLAVVPEVNLRESFDYWLDAEAAAEPQAARAIEEAKADIAPTRAVPGVEHAYWCRMNGKEFVRWVRGEDEDDFFNAFARVYARRESDLEEGARFIGAFRACGLAIPVWELNPGTEAEELSAPLRAMGERLDAALAEEGPLDAAARRAKAGIISRQVNL